MSRAQAVQSGGAARPPDAGGVAPFRDAGAAAQARDAGGADPGPDAGGIEAQRAFVEQLAQLKQQHDAVVLAHNYQRPEIQDAADHVGDSLALARIAQRSPASTIVFCGVHFMAETAKLLAPERRVLLPELGAGCSLADTITAGQLRDWKAEHPGAAVVAYVNTTAAVKAESDVCCTSSNAAEVVESLPAEREVLFLPDQFLGAHVQRVTGRTNLRIWMGECHVHAGISGPELARRVAEQPEAELLIHPECGCATSALYLVGEGVVPAERVRVESTGGMLARARETQASTVLVATEIGMLHQLRRANPGADFAPVNEDASCPYMKMTTRGSLLSALRYGRHEITIDDAVARRARAAVEAMVSIGGAVSGGAGQASVAGGDAVAAGGARR